MITVSCVSEDGELLASGRSDGSHYDNDTQSSVNIIPKLRKTLQQVEFLDGIFPAFWQIIPISEIQSEN